MPPKTHFGPLLATDSGAGTAWQPKWWHTHTMTASVRCSVQSVHIGRRDHDSNCRMLRFLWFSWVHVIYLHNIWTWLCTVSLYPSLHGCIQWWAVVNYFCERVLAPWNYLKITNATLHSVAAFKSLVKSTDLFFLYTCNSCWIDCLYWLHWYLLVRRFDILWLRLLSLINFF